jgi:hypothetical protein
LEKTIIWKGKKENDESYALFKRECGTIPPKKKIEMIK